MAKGLSKEKIIQEAKSLIEEKGMDQFSMHTIASRLNVKTASLYTHIANMNEVVTQASLEILQEYHDQEMAAIEGLEKKAALVALAYAERQYAKEHSAYYQLIMNLQLSDNQELKEAAAIIIEPVMKIMNQYHLSEEQKIHVQRMFRACVFGFVSQEKHGYFAHLTIEPEQSFDFSVDMMASGIEALEDGNRK